MQSSFGIINLAIVGGQPRVLTLKELLEHFVNHRRDVVTRRTRFDLRKAEERAHILEGYLIALGNIDAVIELIKKSSTPEEARHGLMARFDLSEAQAQAILDMRLQRLTALEADKIKAEYEELQGTIARLKAILADDDLLMQVIVDELRAIGERYGDERRTEIIADTGEIDMEDLIADEDMVVTVTTTGYIKRTPLADYRTQRRGGRGRSGMSTGETDAVTNLFAASAHSSLLIFTNRGQVYPLKVWELPKASIAGRGRPIINLIPVEKDEAVQSIVPVESLDAEDRWLVFATRNGVVKRSVLSLYKNVRNNGIRAILLAEDDDLVEVRLACADDAILLATARGQTIIFGLEDVRSVGRATLGVRGIRLRGDDRVVAMEVVRPDPALSGVVDDDDEGETAVTDAEVAEEEEEEAGAAGEEAEDAAAEQEDEELEDGGTKLLFATENGYGKRTPLVHFRVQRRGGLGLRALPYSKRNGELVSLCLASPEDDLMVVTDGGTVIRMPISEVRSVGRSARGVRIINLNGDEKVASIHSVPPSEEEDEPDEEGMGDDVPEDTQGAPAGSEALPAEPADTDQPHPSGDTEGPAEASDESET